MKIDPASGEIEFGFRDEEQSEENGDEGQRRGGVDEHARAWKMHRIHYDVGTECRYGDDDERADRGRAVGALGADEIPFRLAIGKVLEQDAHARPLRPLE